MSYLVLHMDKFKKEAVRGILTASFLNLSICRTR